MLKFMEFFLDIDALRSFIAFVDTGSFTRAAKQTFRTQGAISMQMRKLEEEVGQALFSKEGRNLILTDQGKKLVSYARRILSLHDLAITEFSADSVSQPLRIGCPDDYSESILPDLIDEINQRLPQLHIRVHCDCSTRLRNMLDAGDLDLAILTRAPDKDEGYLLKHDKGVWVHGGFPQLVAQEVLPLVLYEEDCKFHSTAIDGLDKQERPYQLVCASSNATTLKALLKRGVGIGTMATSSISDGLYKIESTTLPPLPAVDIVLAVAPVAHPLFSTAQAAELSRTYSIRESKV